MNKQGTPQAKYNLLEFKEGLNKILNKSQWQAARLPIVSYTEGLDRAYTNNERL